MHNLVLHHRLTAPCTSVNTDGVLWMWRRIRKWSSIWHHPGVRYKVTNKLHTFYQKPINSSVKDVVFLVYVQSALFCTTEWSVLCTHNVFHSCSSLLPSNMPQGKSFWVRITQCLSFQITSYYYYHSVKQLPKTEVVKDSYFASASHRK